MSTVPEKLADHEARLRQIEKALNHTDGKVDELVSFRNWLLGAAAVLGLLVGLFAEKVKTLLGMK